MSRGERGFPLTHDPCSRVRRALDAIEPDGFFLASQRYHTTFLGSELLGEGAAVEELVRHQQAVAERAALPFDARGGVERIRRTRSANGVGQAAKLVVDHCEQVVEGYLVAFPISPAFSSRTS